MALGAWKPAVAGGAGARRDCGASGAAGGAGGRDLPDGRLAAVDALAGFELGTGVEADEGATDCREAAWGGGANVLAVSALMRPRRGTVCFAVLATEDFGDEAVGCCCGRTCV